MNWGQRMYLDSMRPTWPTPEPVKTIKEKLVKSISDSMSAESEAYANYLATKIMREFNVSEKTL